MKRIVTALGIAATITLGAHGAPKNITSGAPDAKSGVVRAIAFDTAYTAIAGATLANPALSPLRHTVSNTDIAAGYRRVHYDTAPSSASGHGTGYGFFEASTYILTGNAAITGHAEYHNGKVYDVQASETTDASILYPYFTADEIGGDMSREVYSFGGSYASGFGAGWLYGASIDYTAVQDWRQVDPRPKNSVGRLNLAGAFGRKFGSYSLALGLDALKYSQSNSIKFVSELGAGKVYHLTGLGTDYKRFAGTGLSSNYSGWRYGADISLYPATEGVFGMASYHRFTFDKQLNDLNRLPVNRAAHTDWTVQAGWRTDNIIVSLTWGRSRRTGFDNIFGDPVGQVYPEIASIASYFMRSWHTGLSGLWRSQGTRHRLDLGGHIDFSHRLDCYISAPVDRRMRADAISYGIEATWVWQCAGEWLLSLKGAADMVSPAKCSLTGLAGADGYFTDMLRADYAYLTHSRALYTARAGIDRLLPHGRTIGLRLSGVLPVCAGDSNGNGFEASAVFSF
ncbi:MAG: hypothetical protein K2M55_06335 [Muribaculaceae bacterium]|nr:hypothetical protein [Muribaculaceae bacterium]